MRFQDDLSSFNSNTNSSTLNTLSHYGISGAFVSKEISLKEQLEIRKNCDMPLFVLGHGVHI
ncbi:MAG: U32 family peptidase [Faecalibacillus intestinalis]|uniref:U32 family peptidase n=1 Tax=Faecalibacillus intestinalis TaxID=1982626 RepID=UPI00399AAE58